MTRLVWAQQRFSKKLADLIHWAYEHGYAITLGEVWRPEETVSFYAKNGIGSKDSLHPLRLAADLNLFKEGSWLKKTEGHRPLGDYWKSLSEPNLECCWGGDFKARPDGNHYSISMGGRK